MKSILYFLCVGVLLLFSHTVEAQFIISAVFPNTIQDSQQEYIEVVNIGSSRQELTGYSLSDSSGKTFTIGRVELDAYERYRFLRPDTKIILNNSNEEVFLIDSQGSIEDSTSYSTSQKGEPITFIDFSNDTISRESRLQLFFSQEAKVVPGVGEPFIEKISWQFQQPSYVIKKEELLDEYYCDTDREECKINLNFLSSFPHGVSPSDYICIIDFGFITGQENTCNPNTIVFPEGDFHISLQIREKHTNALVQEGGFKLYNSSRSEEVKNGENHPADEQENIPIPSIQYNLQIPSYIETTSTGTLVCDSSREECKINFDFRPSFQEGFKESLYVCHIDFGFETTESEKCNPNIIEIPLGEYQFRIRISLKSNITQYTEKILNVVNTGYVGKTTSTKYHKADIRKARLQLMQPRIQIQSGLSKNYVCTKQPCKINLEYEKVFSDEKCLWNFGKGTYTSSTRKRCNPGYVEYGIGEHTVILRIYQKNNPANFKETKIRIVSTESLQDTHLGNVPVFEDLKNENIDAFIEVQGRESQYKTFSGSILTCITHDMCSVNLISSVKYGENIEGLEYMWDLGQGRTSDRANPLSYRYPIGEHHISLDVYHNGVIVGQDKLVVRVKKKLSKLIPSQTDFVITPFFGEIRISRILPNPKGRDIKEFLEIENIGEATSLESCYLQRGTKKYHFERGEFLASQEVLRVYRIVSGLSLPNTQGKIELYCGGELVDTFLWERKIKEGYMLDYTGKSSIYRNNTVHTEEYIEVISYLQLRVLKTGVKLYGEISPHTRLDIVSSQGHNFGLVSDASGIFSGTYNTGFSEGEIQFRASFFYQENQYSLSTEKEYLAKQDIGNFFKTQRKKAGKNQEKKGKLDISFSPLSNQSLKTKLSFYDTVFFYFLLLFLAFLGFCSVLYMGMVTFFQQGRVEVQRIHVVTKVQVGLLLPS